MALQVGDRVVRLRNNPEILAKFNIGNHYSVDPGTLGVVVKLGLRDRSFNDHVHPFERHLVLWENDKKLTCLDFCLEKIHPIPEKQVKTGRQELAAATGYIPSAPKRRSLHT